MDIRVHGRHLEITKAIKDYAQKKASKVEKFFEKIRNVQMILDVEGDNHVVEMIVNVSKGPTLIGVVAHRDMYASIDLVVDKLERQLTKYKEKLYSRKKGRGVITEHIETDEEVEENEYDEYEE